METNGGPPEKKDDQLIPLQKYRTTLYTHSDDPPEKLTPSRQKYKTAFYTKTDNGDLVELGTNDDADDGKPQDGLNVQQTVFLIAGYCPGFAATIMLVAIANTGWTGFLVFGALIFLLAYAATLLGNCWNMVRVAWFEDLNPYGAIAYEAFGGWARNTVNVLIDLVSFGGSIAMLLATSELVLVVIGPALYGTYCYWPFIIGAIMCPAIWVGMPKHFWLLGAFSIISTLLALLVIFIDASIFLHSNEEALDGLEPAVQTWAFGKLMGATIFLMGGHFVYPEIQRAMREPGNFDRGVLTTFLLVLIFLVPTLLVVFFSYGDIIFPDDTDLQAGLLSVLPRDGLVVVPGLLLLLNSAPVLLIIISPLLRHLEEVLNIPEEIGWKRILLRTATIVLIVFIAETVNEFAVIMTLVGGVLLPLLTFLAPAVSFLRLRTMHMPDSFAERPRMYLLDTIVSVVLVAVTPVIMLAVLVITIIALANHETGYVKPCYVQYNTTNSTWDALNTTASL